MGLFLLFPCSRAAIDRNNLYRVTYAHAFLLLLALKLFVRPNLDNANVGTSRIPSSRGPNYFYWLLFSEDEGFSGIHTHIKSKNSVDQLGSGLLL